MENLIKNIIRIVFYCFILTSTAKADIFLKYGLGTGNSALDRKTETKTVSVGHQKSITQNFILHNEVGMWADARTDISRLSSLFLSTGIGLDVAVKFIYTQAILGAGFITHPDAYLGGHFQFSEDIGVGIRDDSGQSIGLNYKHVSSAGIYQPNIGRDFITVKLTIPF